MHLDILKFSFHFSGGTILATKLFNLDLVLPAYSKPLGLQIQLLGEDGELAHIQGTKAYTHCLLCANFVAKIGTTFIWYAASALKMNKSIYCHWNRIHVDQSRHAVIPHDKSCDNDETLLFLTIFAVYTSGSCQSLL